MTEYQGFSGVGPAMPSQSLTDKKTKFQDLVITLEKQSVQKLILNLLANAIENSKESDQILVFV